QRDKAVADFSKAIELQPDHAVAWYNRGNAYRGLGQPAQAVADYSKAIELKPDFAEACNNLGWLYATCPDPHFRKPKEAVALAKKALGRVPAQAYLTLGVAQYRAGDWKAAIMALEKSMELRKGGDSFNWFFLAMAHWQLGETNKARACYDRAV